MISISWKFDENLVYIATRNDILTAVNHPTTMPNSLALYI